MDQSPCRSCSSYPDKMPNCMKQCDKLPNGPVDPPPASSRDKSAVKHRSSPRNGEVVFDKTLREQMHLILEARNIGTSRAAAEMKLSVSSFIYLLYKAVNIKVGTLTKLQLWLNANQHHLKSQS